MTVAAGAGDLGRVIPVGSLMSGQLVLTGRAKDTLVLSGGENVAPAPVEDALCRSPLLEHAMLVGHDRRTLGVLVCLAEDELRLRMEVRALLPPPLALSLHAPTCLQPKCMCYAGRNGEA